MTRLLALALTGLLGGCVSALPLSTPSLPAPLLPAPSPAPAGFPDLDTSAADSSVLLARLDQSERTWRQLRDEVQGNYHYQVRWQSWVGFGRVTTVRVQNNRVSERKFEPFYKSSAVSVTAPVDAGWVERGPEIGSREGFAAPALTLDALYDSCRRLLSEPAPTSSERPLRWQAPVLALDERGVLQSCTSTQALVVGDAPVRGVPALALSLGP